MTTVAGDINEKKFDSPPHSGLIGGVSVTRVSKENNSDPLSDKMSHLVGGQILENRDAKVLSPPKNEMTHFVVDEKAIKREKENLKDSKIPRKIEVISSPDNNLEGNFVVVGESGQMSPFILDQPSQKVPEKKEPSKREEFTNQKTFVERKQIELEKVRKIRDEIEIDNLPTPTSSRAFSHSPKPIVQLDSKDDDSIKKIDRLKYLIPLSVFCIALSIYLYTQNIFPRICSFIANGVGSSIRPTTIWGIHHSI